LYEELNRKSPSRNTTVQLSTPNVHRTIHIVTDGQTDRLTDINCLTEDSIVPTADRLKYRANTKKQDREWNLLFLYVFCCFVKSSAIIAFAIRVGLGYEKGN